MGLLFSIGCKRTRIVPVEARVNGGKKGIGAIGYFFRYRREVGDIELRGKL
jgi:hypothetical protein